VWNLNRLKINFFERYGEGGLRIKNKKYKNPLFSLCTGVYNREKYLEKTLDSVNK